MRDKSKVKIKIKHIPQGYASWPVGQRSTTFTHRQCLHICLAVCVCSCVCFVLFCWQIAHVRDAILLLTYRSRPDWIRLALGFRLPLLPLLPLLSCVCVVCSNLIWNFCAIQQDMAKIWQRTQYEKVLWGKLRINVFNNSRNGRWSHNKSQLPLLLLSLLYFVWKRATVMAGKHNGTSAGVITHWEYPESSCKSDCFLTSCKAVDAKKTVAYFWVMLENK